MALTITNISKVYPNGVRALKNLSLTIGNNMFGLLGPNGAGKSSLMRTIATLQDPDSGSIDLDGVNVLTQKDAVRKILGYLPQEFGVYPKDVRRRHAEPSRDSEGRYRGGRAQGDGGCAAAPDQSVGCAEEGVCRLTRAE